MTSTILKAVADARSRLAQAGVPEAPLEADLVVAAALKTDRAHLYALLNEALPAIASRALEAMLRRRVQREPLAYIVGHREFYGLEFKVGRGVLIPRPETETLIEEAIRIVGGRRPHPNPLPSRERIIIADVGTGCGASAVSLAVHVPGAYIYATDVSRRAIATAQANATAHGIQDRITFLHGNLLRPVPAKASLITANLPYLPISRLPTLQPEVSLYEPRKALDGGPDGLRLVRRLLRESPGCLEPSGAILVELDPEQMEAAESVALVVYPHATLRRVKDLAGLERVLVVQV
ncbi:MAG: peptide chain release factor N(5)-glutamine methyltransferase [Chloroflexi bacterium]|nr:peptide chain release factor N(5)-glutamine methyltransferase [Chloroflexota bacterium]